MRKYICVERINIGQNFGSTEKEKQQQNQGKK